MLPFLLVKVTLTTVTIALQISVAQHTKFWGFFPQNSPKQVLAMWPSVRTYKDPDFLHLESMLPVRSVQYWPRTYKEEHGRMLYLWLNGPVPEIAYIIYAYIPLVRIQSMDTENCKRICVTGGNHLLVSYRFVFLYSSWDYHSKHNGVVCYFLLRWITFCQNSPLWPVHLGWPYMAWLIASWATQAPLPWQGSDPWRGCELDHKECRASKN